MHSWDYFVIKSRRPCLLILSAFFMTFKLIIRYFYDVIADTCTAQLR